MSKPGVSVATDPESYTYKDLLLLSQLLHRQGLIEPSAVTAGGLTAIGKEWFDHKSTQLSRNKNEFPVQKPLTSQQIVRLYENMLELNVNCATTTDLANFYYFARMEELKAKLEQDKIRFNELLETSIS